MMNFSFVLAPLALAALVAGCSSTSVSAQQQRAQDYCARRAACGADTLDCEKALFGVHLPDACVPAAEAATCAELSDKTSAAQKACFPPCDINTAPACASDLMTACTTNGGLVTIECSWYCHNIGKSYAGSCGNVAVSTLTPMGGTACVCN
jgi:hypothetical protein